MQSSVSALAGVRPEVSVSEKLENDLKTFLITSVKKLKIS